MKGLSNRKKDYFYAKITIVGTENKYTGLRSKYMKETQLKSYPRKSIYELILFYASDMNISESEAMETMVKYFLSKYSNVKQRFYATRQSVAKSI